MITKKYDIEQIKNKIKLSELVNKYTKVYNTSNDEYNCKCLFHDDRTPSMYINDDKGVFNCFGCGASGDAITIIEQVEGIDFKEAVNKLVQENNIELSTITEKVSQSSDLTDLIEELKDIESDAVFEDDYLKKYNETKHRYLLDLGFQEETLEEFEIGYCYDSNDIMYNRVTIPWRNTNKELVAIVGRDVSGDSKDKYKSCFGSKKSRHLYNLDKAKNYADNGLILVEDEKSVMRLWEWDYKNAVALGGSQLGSKKWLLREYTDTVYVCMDNCQSGREIQQRIIPKLYSIMNVYVIDLPEGYKDVAEIQDKDIWDECWNNKRKVKK